MISIARLQERLVDNWVAFDKNGEPVDLVIPSDIGPATLMVSDVTDALKIVDEADRVGASVDRSRMWAVDAIVLNAIALRRLEGRVLTAAELIGAVREAGLVWQISSTSAP